MFVHIDRPWDEHAKISMKTAAALRYKSTVYYSLDVPRVPKHSHTTRWYSISFFFFFFLLHRLGLKGSPHKQASKQQCSRQRTPRRPFVILINELSFIWIISCCSVGLVCAKACSIRRLETCHVLTTDLKSAGAYLSSQGFDDFPFCWPAHTYKG